MERKNSCILFTFFPLFLLIIVCTSTLSVQDVKAALIPLNPAHARIIPFAKGIIALNEMQINALEPLALNDIWIGGEYVDQASNSSTQPFIEHYDGKSWSLSTLLDAHTHYAALISGFSATSNNDIWAVGNFDASPLAPATTPLIEHWNGNTWSAVHLTPPFPTGYVGGTLNAVQAVASNDTWMVGNMVTDDPTRPTKDQGTLALHWDGKGIHVETTPATPQGSSSNLAAIATLTNKTLLAAGYGATPALAERWNGQTWQIAALPGHSSFLSISAQQANNVWLLQSYPEHAATYWNGKNWSEMTLPNANFTSIVAPSSINVWALGSRLQSDHSMPPLVAHYDGKKWVNFPLPTQLTALPVWAAYKDGTIGVGLMDKSWGLVSFCCSQSTTMVHN